VTFTTYFNIMKITILNGDSSPDDSDFTKYVSQLKKLYIDQGNEVEVFTLSAMNLKYCIGCWTCWWKTPGRCVHKDDGELIFRSVINADFFIFASPLVAGFTTALLKKITDRLIVLLHPYILIKEGEFHHHKRYDTYPEFGLLISRETSTDDEDIQIVEDIYKRLAINFHSRLRFLTITNEHLPEETAHATYHF
jgi:multimeric flavodoxin WrbA